MTRKYFYKQFLTSALALSLMATSTLPALAAGTTQVVGGESGQGTGNSKVTLEVLEAEPDVMVATVPVELPIVMDGKGKITVASDAKITNASTNRSIQVSKITAALAEGWEAADYNDDFANMEEGTKKVALALRGDTLSTEDSAFALSDDNWNIGTDDSLKLNMGAKLPKQGASAKTEIATISFTLNWTEDNKSTSDSLTGASDQNQGTAEDNTPNTANGSSMLAEAASNAGYSWSNSGNGVIINSFSNPNKDTTINIPEEIGGLKVQGINSGAFNNTNCRVIEKVVMPDTIRTIGYNAFNGDTALTQVVFSKGLEDIGQSAFTGTALTSVSLPDSVWRIQANAFSKCSQLTTVKLSKNLTTIDNQAFYQDRSLTSITIPGRVTSIGNQVFTNCSKLESAVVENGVTSLGEQTFQACFALRTVSLPSSLSRIQKYAFANCANLQSITLPDKITYLEGYTFQNCGNLKTVNLPMNLTYMGVLSGYTTSHPNFSSYVQGHDFDGCQNIETITMPSNLQYIERHTFSNCFSLRNIYYTGSTNLGTAGAPDAATSVLNKS